MADRPRVILEKSRTVRRRYQRSNKRFQFTEAQIARIEREEERERRAQKLREKEKRRVEEKKKKAKVREERMRLGIPDPNAPTVPGSQPLLFNFIKRTPSVQPESQEEQVNTGSETEVATEFEDEDKSLEDEELDSMLIALGEAEESTVYVGDVRDKGRDEDEFSECSAFDDVIEETGNDLEKQMPAATVGDSFQDDTAVLLEQFAPEFDPSASFDQELAQLDAT
ncbi:hypothetical protein BDW62DRAFT_198487 [Aspergillus aurantiobrunneus]